MFADIFINRPRLAMVIAIIITLAGTIALLNIPVAQYPDITPPTVQVTASYPGADAQTLAETVAAPIEQQVNGAPPSRGPPTAATPDCPQSRSPCRCGRRSAT